MPKKKDQTKGREKRHQIRKAAYRAFREHGYTATTVDGICQAASISKGSFYWHYPSKQDVFVDIIETWTREIMDELYEQFEDAMRPDDFESGAVEALERELHRGRVLVPLWLEFTVLGRRVPEIQQALAKFYRRARSALAGVLRPQMAERFTETEIQATAATAFGAYMGLLFQELSDPETLDASTEMGHFIATMKKAASPFLPDKGH